MGHRFDPKHVERLTSSDRRKMLPPEKLLAELDIQTSCIVADIGCGPGYFTLPAARMTKQTVYGVDVSPEMLVFLKQRAQDEGIQNISLVESSAEHIELDDESVDRILCSLVLHEVDDLHQVFREFKRILRPQGKMLLIEWTKKQTDSGPPIHERIAAEDLNDTLSEFGWSARHIQPNSDQYALLVEVSK